MLRNRLSFLSSSPTTFLLLFILFSCSNEVKTAENTNVGEEMVTGLKDINPGIPVGANFQFDQNQKYLDITETEFSANQILFYAGFGGWNNNNVYDFSLINQSVNWLEEKDIGAHVHMLFGPNFYMPDWLKNGGWTPEELDGHMQDLIRSIMDSNNNKDKVIIWNVMNELFDDGGSYRSDMVWNQMGTEVDASNLTGEESINAEHPVFIRKAFEYCRNMTDAKLEYRDYLIENNNPGTGWDKKHKATYQLLKHMINSNIPIDAVGIQGHYNIGEVDWVLENNGLAQVIQKFSALGLEVYITELDIGTQEPWTQEMETQQRTEFYNYVRQAVEGGVDRVYTWGVNDGRDLFWRADEHPLLWDENLEKKEAYFGVEEALMDTK